MKICVFGAASNKIDQSYIDAVEKLGEEIALRGHTLIFGAGCHGLMGATARGVRKYNGRIIGVIPSFFRDENIEPIFEECDDLIYTSTMSERVTTMTNIADAFITVPGGIGTFEEFFEVITLKQLGRHSKPIAIFDVKNYFKKLDEFLQTSAEEKFISDNCKTLYDYSDNVDEILNYIENDERVIMDVHDLKFD